MKFELDSLCNQCKSLVFSVPGCKRGGKTPEGKPALRDIPSTYTNDEGFINVLKPCWCPGKQSFKEKNQKQGG